MIDADVVDGISLSDALNKAFEDHPLHISIFIMQNQVVLPPWPREARGNRKKCGYPTINKVKPSFACFQERIKALYGYSAEQLIIDIALSSGMDGSAINS